MNVNMTDATICLPLTSDAWISSHRLSSFNQDSLPGAKNDLTSAVTATPLMAISGTVVNISGSNQAYNNT